MERNYEPTIVYLVSFHSSVANVQYFVHVNFHIVQRLEYMSKYSIKDYNVVLYFHRIMQIQMFLNIHCNFMPITPNHRLKNRSILQPYTYQISTIYTYIYIYYICTYIYIRYGLVPSAMNRNLKPCYQLH